MATFLTRTAVFSPDFNVARSHAPSSSTRLPFTSSDMSFAVLVLGRRSIGVVSLISLIVGRSSSVIGFSTTLVFTLLQIRGGKSAISAGCPFTMRPFLSNLLKFERIPVLAREFSKMATNKKSTQDVFILMKCFTMMSIECASTFYTHKVAGGKPISYPFIIDIFILI